MIPGARSRAWLGASLLALGCASAPEVTEGPDEERAVLEAPPGFPLLRAPEDNQPTAARIALGRRLFYDERLSGTGEVSCASCHLQANAFADPNRFSAGVSGRTGTRNAPGLVNQAWGNSFFWDGRVATLEEQASQPILNHLEMDTTLEEVAARLAEDRALRAEFERAYAAPPAEDTITRALASFVRSLISAGSSYDAFLAGDDSALSPAARRGEAVFNGERGECFHCHVGYNLTSQGFRNNGIAADDPDVGRSEITGKATDMVQNGHELSGHSVKHPCDEGHLASYTVAQMEAELDDNIARLERLGAAQPFTFGYPCLAEQGVGSPKQDFGPGVAARFIAARKSPELVANPLTVDLYAVPNLEPMGKSAEQLRAYVDDAIAQQGFIMFGFHGVGPEVTSCPQGSDYAPETCMLNHNVSDADAHLALFDYLVEKQAEIWTTTFKEAVLCFQSLR